MLARSKTCPENSCYDLAKLQTCNTSIFVTLSTKVMQWKGLWIEQTFPILGAYQFIDAGFVTLKPLANTKSVRLLQRIKVKSCEILHTHTSNTIILHPELWNHFLLSSFAGSVVACWVFASSQWRCAAEFPIHTLRTRRKMQKFRNCFSYNHNFQG